MIERRWHTTSALLLVTACAHDPHLGAAISAAAASEASSAPVQQASEDAVVTRARRALADSGIEPQGFKVESVHAAQWTDSSLGCRRPGQVYLQVITDGQVVRLAGGGKVYEVHVAGDAAAICGPGPAGVLRQSNLASRARNLDQMLEQARTDLAGRMNADRTQVRVRNLKPTVWPDAGLDCGRPTTGAPRKVAGYQLFLEFQGRIFTYHTDMQQVMLCPPMANE